MALFAPAAARPQQNSNHLVEFRAGKMNMRAANMVHPDKRKGLVYLYQAEDSLMHFCWKDRNTGTVEDDLIIFPEDAEFVNIKQCTTGRVFLLKLKATSKKHFFWMQEPKKEKDEELCKKVNDMLNHPPPPGSARTAGRSAAAGGAAGGIAGMMGGAGADDYPENMSELLGNMSSADQSQLMQLMQLMGAQGGTGAQGLSDMMGAMDPSMFGEATSGSGRWPASGGSRPADASATGQEGSGARSFAASTPASAASNRPAVQLSDLQSILANMNVPASAAGEQQAMVHLEDVLNGENIEPSLTNDDAVNRVLPHLPSQPPIVEQNREELQTSIRSPQFRQAVEMFGAALQTGQLAPLLTQFGFSGDAASAASRGDIEQFASALEQAESGDAPPQSAEDADSSSSAAPADEKEPAPKKNKTDQDDEMELD